MTMTILDAQNDLPTFRQAIRDWLAAVVPHDWKSRMAAASNEDYIEFQRWWMAERSKVGLAIPHWPKEYGGAGLTLQHLIAIADEMARADAPQNRVFTISLIHMPGTLLPHGTEAQKRRYLSGVAKGEVWCQGFSEPNSGSDLASLRTRAVRDGDHYVINGQKIWSSNSMYADHCLLLTRTDPNAQKHRGITYFIMDMRTPGVEVRPIRQANGRSEFGEIFLTDVRIPAANMVGAENNGWRVAQATLASERGVISFEGAERQRYEIEAFYRKSLHSGAAWLKDVQLHREFMTFLAEMQAGRRLLRRVLAESAKPEASASVLPSIVKLSTTVLRQRICSFMTRIAGVDGQELTMLAEQPFGSPMFDFMSAFSGTIAGGTNEIQRNIVAERGLGMPRI
jgi:alkylation response protein AidB-like acyl-CoA dehydrogenase